MTRRYQVGLHEMTKQGLDFVAGAVSGYCKPRQKPHFCFRPPSCIAQSFTRTTQFLAFFCQLLEKELGGTIIVVSFSHCLRCITVYEGILDRSVAYTMAPMEGSYYLPEQTRSGQCSFTVSRQRPRFSMQQVRHRYKPFQLRICPLPSAMATNHVLSITRSSTEDLGMDFGWGLDSYVTQYGIPDLTNTNMSMAYDAGNENLG
jgi:hypothetical protein